MKSRVISMRLSEIEETALKDWLAAAAANNVEYNEGEPFKWYGVEHRHTRAANRALDRLQSALHSKG